MERARRKTVRTTERKKGRKTGQRAPVPNAIAGPLPTGQRPQLATLAQQPPAGEGWLNEIKFDGYRLLLLKDGDSVRVVSRNGQDWTARLPTLAAAVARLPARQALLDGELVVLDDDGVSRFSMLQRALSERREDKMLFYAFDLPHLDGWDLRPCRQIDRKAALAGLHDWRGMLRFSEHHQGDNAAMREQACRMRLEGIVCKQADAPYRAGRGHAWLKLKCLDREEFVVLGWTPPAGSRTGLGALQLGYYDARGRLHYAGGVGTGFSEQELSRLQQRLREMSAEPPGMLLAGEAPDRRVRWVTPELVAEVQYTGWSGAGRLRHAVYLGLREDKAAREVRRPVADAEVKRTRWGGADAPRKLPAAASRIATPARRATPVRRAEPADDTVRLTHPDRELWPGITKRDLAEYWSAIGAAALPDIAGRPLALLRCPEGINKEKFFQKHATPGFPPQIGHGEVDGAPYLTVGDMSGLLACVQISAIELHAWGASLADPERPDRMVFDLDPGEGVAFAEVVRAALELRQRLERMRLASLCRTTGGKGLHVVVPLRADAGWERVRDFSQALARLMEQEQPDRYVASVPKERRRGHILIDWLRNGLGATSVASFSPRARPGATVAVPLHWREVNAALDPAAFTVATVPARLRRQRSDPWRELADSRQMLPELG